MKPPTLSELFAAAVKKHKRQKIVAEKCGITQGMVSSYIRGKTRSVDSKNIIKIAHCLGVKVAVLLAACGQNDSNTSC